MSNIFYLNTRGAMADAESILFSPSKAPPCHSDFHSEDCLSQGEESGELAAVGDEPGASATSRRVPQQENRSGRGVPPYSRGFALLASLILLGGLSLTAAYFVSAALQDLRIAQAHGRTLTAYYLAEAGTAEMIKELRTDVVKQAQLIAGTLTPSNSTITRSDVFAAGNSYTVTAESTAPGVADIVSTGLVNRGGRTAQRAARTTIGRATGTSETWASPLFAGGLGGQQNGNITITVPTTISNGPIQANQNFKAQGSTAIVTVTNGDVRAANNIIVQAGATLTVVGGTQQEAVPVIAMPQIDFDSSNPNSWRNRADTLFTPSQFNALPSGTTLTGINYVTGDLIIDNQTLIIAGMLVVGGDLTVDNPANLITVIEVLAGSGILVKENFIVESSLEADGLIYAAQALKVDGKAIPTTVNVTGGIVGWRVIIEGNATTTVTITFDEAKVSVPLDPNLNNGAPLLLLNHWEEEY